TYRALASDNRANAAMNRAVGERALDRVLANKPDSLYTPDQFDRVLAYLERQRREGKDARLAGVVFVEGTLIISQTLVIEDGALIVRGSLRLEDRARLEVRHSPKTASLPGVIVSGDGGIIRLGRDAVAIVDGLLFASTGVEVLKARVDVLGAIVAGQGFVNEDGLVVVRYHPGVLRTVGLTRTEHVLLSPLTWQELP
ncbi:MAG: hypothetical protein ACT4PY_11905, partial [Armatimonadota bacterium]